MMEHFEGKAQNTVKYSVKINILQIHTNKLQLASGEPPAFTLYIHIYRERERDGKPTDKLPVSTSEIPTMLQNHTKPQRG